jgi:hypothetical protein
VVNQTKQRHVPLPPLIWEEEVLGLPPGSTTRPKMKLYSCLDEFRVTKKQPGPFSENTSVSSPPFNPDHQENRKKKLQKVT